MTLATGKPAVAVPTLRALAWNLPFAAHPVCPLLDARKNEVYAALYRFEGARLVQLMEESAIALNALPQKISGPVIFSGEAAQLYRAAIEERFGGRALFAPLSASLPSAAAVAELGLDLIKEGKQADLDSLAPLYIRRPEAEVAWEKRQTSR